MTDDGDEGSGFSGFSAGVLEHLRRRNADAATIVQERTRESRRADMTEAEKHHRRGRPKGPPRKQLNMRVSVETDALAHELAIHLGKSMPDTIALALAALALQTPGFQRGDRLQ